MPWVSRLADGTFRAIVGPDMVTLHTTVTLHGHDLTTVGEFDVAAGITVPFVLTHGSSHLALPNAIDPKSSLEHTETFWKTWSARSRSQGEWSESVTRSLITLKALTYAPTGGIVAAATTSLPERLGGVRNWDYRFCWLRDATLTLLALMNAGYYSEAAAWRDWLLRAAAGAPSQLQIMYGLAGERRLTEYEVGWLPGYAESRPVRIGNAAHAQLQLDVFGEVMDALHQGRRGGLALREEDWAFQRAMLEHLGTVWNQPDEGIWEVRGGPRHFTHSKVMAWVAFDRAIKATEQFGLRGPVDRWRAVRSTTMSARMASIAGWGASCSRTVPRSSMPVCCYCRRSASCHRPIRGSKGPSQRSSGGCSSMDFCSAMTRTAAMTGCLAVRELFWRAASGWRTPMS